MGRLDTTHSTQMPPVRQTPTVQTASAKPTSRPVPVITDYASL